MTTAVTIKVFIVGNTVQFRGPRNSRLYGKIIEMNDEIAIIESFSVDALEMIKYKVSLDRIVCLAE